MQENVFGSNHFVALDLEDYTCYEMGDTFVNNTRGRRSIKPSQNIQEMEWLMIGRHVKRGREGKESRGLPH